MPAIRGCLTLVGLWVLLMITFGVLGVSSCTRAFNPTSFIRTVDEAPDKTRRMLRDFLETATYEAEDKRGLGVVPATLAVQDLTDGSIRLQLTGNQGPLLAIVAHVADAGEGRSEVDVSSDANALADALRHHPDAATMHRRIKARIVTALSAIDNHEVAPRGLLISQLTHVDRSDF